MLVVVTDRYDFEFSIKAAERKRWTKDSTHMQETEIIDNRNVQRHFKVTLGIRSIKPAWCNHGEIRFLKMERNIVIRFNLLSNHFLANLDGATDCVTSQSSERIDFYCDHEGADTKMFRYIKFLCDMNCNFLQTS